jgi:CheY-like chemotaxis protein
VAAAVSPRVLIIENDFLIGEMIHDMVRGLGYTVTRTVHRVPSALREIGKENFDAALVNIGIDEQNHGEDIADILMEMGVSFWFRYWIQSCIQRTPCTRAAPAKTVQ